MLSYRGTAISQRRSHSPGAYEATGPRRAQHYESTIRTILTGKWKGGEDNLQRREGNNGGNTQKKRIRKSIGARKEAAILFKY